MRLKTVVAADPKAALQEIRTSLGRDAVIVASQALKDGRVRVTAAVDDEDPDLERVLAAPAPTEEAGWFRSLADHHTIPAPLRARLGPMTGGQAETDPVAQLGQALNATLRFAPLDGGHRPGILLSGPPGAGKTLTLAKLAARATLAGQRVRVVSTDVERAGGLEPLRALLAPLDLAPLAVPDPGSLRRPGGTEADVTLIDTAAVNPYRAADIARLSRLIERAALPPVLVLPAGYDPGDAAEIAGTYASLGGERLVATKLDLARRFGGLLAAADAGLALADAGIGPTVGQGLRPFTAHGLARLLLHGQLRAISQGGGERP
jgi:flagellar biosynthesis protein FlhF